MFSDRVQAIKPSLTLAVGAKANELKRQGIDVINMGTGEPDFDTPEHIKQAAVRAIESGRTKYTAADGIPELKEAIIAKFKRDNQLEYDMDQVMASTGAKQAIFNLLTALLNPGDEVVVAQPCWVSYPDMVTLCGGTPVLVQATLEQQLKISPKQLEAAITAKTKLLMINSPSNPTGMMYSRQEWAALAEVLNKHPHVLIMTDDIYEHIQWSKEGFSNLINVCPELYDRTVVINGVSKAYAMTGWRIGVAAGPVNIIKTMKKIQSQSTSCACSISQAAATEALAGDQSDIPTMVKAFHRRHDIFVSGLNALPGIECLPGQGAFYAFPCVQHAIGKLDGVNDDIAFATYLLEKARIAAVPGSAFGAPGHIRFSYACSIEQIEETLKRIKQAL